MRAIVYLRAKTDFAYDNRYNRKLRGRLWKALSDTVYEDRHDDGNPIGLSFSNPFPPAKTINEGDRMKVLVAATKRDLLGTVLNDFNENRSIDIGQMQFRVSDAQLVDADVGPPGSTGTLKTETPVVCRLRPEDREQYGIDEDEIPHDPDQKTYWRPEFSVEPFMDRITRNLAHKHHLFEGDGFPDPTEVDYDLFTGYELEGTYANPLRVTPDTEITLIVSEWTFDYEVEDRHHRRFLNLLLDAGMGERNSYGFGFINPVEA